MFFKKNIEFCFSCGLNLRFGMFATGLEREKKIVTPKISHNITTKIVNNKVDIATMLEGTFVQSVI